MTRMIFRYIMHFLLLVLLQLFVFNNVYLLQLIHPLIYVYFILFLPLSLNKNLLLLFAFGLGFIIDIFSNSYGMHTASSLLIAFLRTFYLNYLLAEEPNESHITPNIGNMGLRYFLFYILFFVFIHHFCLHIIQAYGFRDILFTLLKIILNTIFSSFVILIYGLSFYFSEEKSK